VGADTDDQGPALSSTSGVGQFPTSSGAREVTVAIMGSTGSGKSTFINLISGSNLCVGNGLRSCTKAVQLGGAFDLDGHRVVLIDTPGFDDTVTSDTDILTMIADFLANSYDQGQTLAGVLYFHRISDFKMGGTSTRNFKVFRRICGDSTLRNVVVVTNMWGEVQPEVGDAREDELKKDNAFFKPVLENGGKMARHENTISSAENIIRRVLDNHPLPLRIQTELVVEKRDISQTGAGKELHRELTAQIKKHQAEMRVLKAEMEQAIKDRDEKTRRELGVDRKKMEEKIERLEDDINKLKSRGRFASAGAVMGGGLDKLFSRLRR